MEETIPQLTTEQKLVIREAQLQMASLQNQIQVAHNTSSQIEQKLVQYINGISTDLKIDSNLISFDINRLVFYTKEIPVKPENGPS